MLRRKRLFVLLTVLSPLYALFGAFLLSGLVVIDMRPRASGMGNHMFRYAAGVGLVERGFYVCWSNYSWDQGWMTPLHEHSFFLYHVQDPGALEECSVLTGLLATIFLPRIMLPFSTYVPIEKSWFTRRMDASLESFRYFPKRGPRPLFHLKQLAAAREWMRLRNLTSAVHVRRGDYAKKAAPLAYYQRVNVSQAVVVTDDPAWARAAMPGAIVSESHDSGFDMALLAAATDTVVIGVGTYAWWGAYLSDARRVIYYAKQAGYDNPGYREADRMPSRWVRAE